MSFPLSQNALSKNRLAYLAGGALLLLAPALLYKFGILAVLALGMFLGAVMVTPMLLNRYMLFLVLWMCIAPAFDNWRGLLIAGANPIVFLMTGLTVPFAGFLILRSAWPITKELPFLGWLLAFDAVLFINILRPDTPVSGSLLEFLKLFIELFIVFCGYYIIREGKSATLFKALNTFMIVDCIIAFMQRLSGIGMMVIEGVPRVGGLVGHPNCLAFLNVVYIPFGIYQVLTAKEKKDQTFWLTGVILSIMVLLLTMCKSVIIALILQFIALFFFLPNKLKVRLGLVTVGGAILFLAANFILNLGFFDQFADRMNNTSSLEWRLKIWGYLLSDMGPVSMLIGHGTESTREFIRVMDPTGSDHAHNVYLQLLYEYGATGLPLLLAFIVPAFTFGKTFLLSKGREKLISIMPLLIIMAILLNMASDNSIFLRTPMSFAWIFLVYFYMTRNQKHEEAPTSSKKRLTSKQKRMPT